MIWVILLLEDSVEVDLIDFLRDLVCGDGGNFGRFDIFFID